jgi:sec-independent protein translocase protein TatA
MPHWLGTPELIVILVVILIIFGVGKLPQVGGAIGQGLREFRKAQLGEEDKEEVQPKKRATKKTASGRTKKGES